MDEAALKAEWFDFAKRLRPVGMGIFGGTSIKITEQGAADIRIVGLLLLARTLSNLKAAIKLSEGGFIVEAKVIARCCFENSYWVGALVKEGDKFRASMVQHEMKHKRMRGQTVFSTTTGGLNGELAISCADGCAITSNMRIHRRLIQRRCASARKTNPTFSISTFRGTRTRLSKR